MTNATINHRSTGNREGQIKGDLIDKNISLINLGRPRRARVTAALVAGTAIILLAAGAWFLQSGELQFSKPPRGLAQTEHLISIEPRSVSSQLDISGTIAAGRSVAIVAPFDGVIREKRVQLGDHVNVGDILVVIDTSDIASRYRDAQSAYLKAAMADEVMNKWENSSDVLRARRALETAETAFTSLERQVTELKALLDQGIVSRNEYDGLVQQREAQLGTVAGARDELSSTLERGNSVNRQLVTLELENTQSRLSDLKQQMAGAKVATAVAGVVTRPPIDASGQKPASVEPGASLTRGTAIFSIADTSSFIVSGVVDEVDVNRVKIGQAANIASDAFPSQTIKGKIVSVSAEAGSGSGERGSPSFEVRAGFSVDDERLRQVIRIGMSAGMTVETYSNPAAIIVPPAVVIDIGNGPTINIRRKGERLTVPVLLGETFPEGVEVISGLNAGDAVWLP